MLAKKEKERVTAKVAKRRQKWKIETSREQPFLLTCWWLWFVVCFKGLFSGRVRGNGCRGDTPGSHLCQCVGVVLKLKLNVYSLSGAFCSPKVMVSWTFHCCPEQWLRCGNSG